MFDVDIPVSLFVPVLSFTFIVLGASEQLLLFLVKLFIGGYTQVSSQSRTITEVFLTSVVISIICIVSYGNREHLAPLIREYSSESRGVYAGFEGTVDSTIVVWLTLLNCMLVNFTLERFCPIRGIFTEGVISTKSPTDPGEKLKAEIPADTLSMVPWYGIAMTTTAIDLIISFKLFLGRFDMRTLQFALSSARSNLFSSSGDSAKGDEGGRRDGGGSGSGTDGRGQWNYLSDDEDLWFDFMADCGDGFNSSYHIARSLAQPSLEVNLENPSTAQSIMEAVKQGNLGKGVASIHKLEEIRPLLKYIMKTDPSSSSGGSKVPRSIMLPRGKLLVIGGDLAYPSPSAETYEKRLFRTFEEGGGGGAGAGAGARGGRRGGRGRL